jgi:hypothetical protein
MSGPLESMVNSRSSMHETSPATHWEIIGQSSRFEARSARANKRAEPAILALNFM